MDGTGRDVTGHSRLHSNFWRGTLVPSINISLGLQPGCQRCVLQGFEQALERKRREFPPIPKLLNGEQEAHIIALRLGPPPKGYANWSLRLLARRVVELAVVESISHETIRRTLKKTG